MSAVPADDPTPGQRSSGATQSDLEYRDAADVAVDPRALPLLAPRDCRRLRAVPLEATTGGVVVGIDAPSEERFEAVCEKTGPNTRFVLLDDRTLDALLSSRIFADSTPVDWPTAVPAAEPAPAAPPPASLLSGEPAPEPLLADEAPTESPTLDEDDAEPLVEAEPELASEPELVVEPEPAAADEAPELSTEAADAELATEPDLAPEPAAEPEPTLAAEDRAELLPAAAETPLPADAAKTTLAAPAASARSEAVAELLARIDAAVLAWSDVRAAVLALDEELDASKRLLRETKEQLAVARAESDQEQLRIRSLETELEQERTVVAAARQRLIAAADALSEEEVTEPPLHISDPD
jgi:hypothetical protein